MEYGIVAYGHTNKKKHVEIENYPEHDTPTGSWIVPTHF